MANQRATFAKRQREMELKDRAKQKKERRDSRRSEPKIGGPQIAWDEAVRAVVTPMEPIPSLVPTDDTSE